MTYCSNCGNKLNSNAEYCNNCGEKVDPILPKKEHNNQKESITHNNRQTDYIKTNEIIKSTSGGFWKAIIWIIVILVLLFIFMSVVSNISNNEGSLNVYSDTQNSWWGTTHKTTTVGSNGVATEEHSCPFWNRNC